jgi:outer membrane receptor protein involved in Fe transport
LTGYDLIPEKAIVNFAWSRTVARPTFFEFLPIESIAQDSGIVRRGNPDLTETSIENIDLGVDLQLPWGITGRISAFHKMLEDPIVVVQRVDLGQNINSYVNGEEGTISGIELEGRWKVEGPFSINGNYTFIDSTLNYDVNQGLVVTPLETRFPFQPAQILNLTLGWEPDDIPWSVFLTANFTDEYPTVLRSEPEDYDVWQLPQFTLDLVIARKFENDWMDATVSLGIRNLTEESRNFEYRGGPVGSVGALNGLVYTTDEPGRTVYLELKGSF